MIFKLNEIENEFSLLKKGCPIIHKSILQ